MPHNKLEFQRYYRAHEISNFIENQQNPSIIANVSGYCAASVFFFACSYDEDDTNYLNLSKTWDYQRKIPEQA